MIVGLCLKNKCTLIVFDRRRKSATCVEVKTGVEIHHTKKIVS